MLAHVSQKQIERMSKMIAQETFGAPMIAAPNEAHMACVLLLDTSGSMQGEPINSLNWALQDFKNKLSMDEMARKRIDICIIEFNSTANLVQWFTPISQMPIVNLKATGVTAMGEGINMARFTF